MTKLLLFFSLWLGVSGVVVGQNSTLLKDIFPLAGSSVPLTGADVMTSLGKSVLFTADNSVNGYELWVSDGTEAGTKLLKDIYPGDRNKSSSPNYYTVQNGIGVFEAIDNASGQTKLYRTDGTESGTYQIWDRGYSSLLPGFYKKPFATDTSFYLVTDYPKNNPALVIKSLSGPGVQTILDKSLSADISYLPFLISSAQVARFGTKWLFMGINTQNKQVLYSSDGTKAGTIPIIVRRSSLTSSVFTASTPTGQLGFFVEDDGINGEELWKTDGTAGGTKMIKNIAPGGLSGASSVLSEYSARTKNGIIFFGDDGVHGQEIWFSDGTENGTLLLKEFAEGSRGSFPTILTLTDDDQPYLYNSSTSELWRTDGTVTGTRLITKFNSLNRVNSSSFQKVGDNLYGLSLALTGSFGHREYNIIRINTKTDQVTVLGHIEREEQYINSDFAVTENALYYVGYADNTGYEPWKFPLCAHSAKINTTNGTTFCPGSSVAITAEGSGGTGPYTYKWKLGTSDVGTNTNLSVTKAGTYVVEVTSQGCTVSTSVEVKETTNLPVTITGSNAICVGTSAPLSATVSGGVAPYTYQWKQAGGNIVGATTSTLSVTTTGTYSVSATDSKGCTGTSSSFAVTVKPSPIATITTATTSLTTGASAVLVTPAASGQTYQWYKGGQAIAGATNNTYTTLEAGQYTVTVTRDGCSTTSSIITLQMVLATEPTPTSLGLAVSPNPVLQNTDVRLSMLKAAPATFTLLDGAGKVVGEWQATQIRNVHELTLPMKSQPTGIYFLRVEANGLQVVRRILKQ